jgi:nickel transport protein
MRVVLLLLCATLAGPALAHEVLHEVRHGKAVAVRVFESDGDPVAMAAFEVFAPADPKHPWSTGRTDRDGWLAFVPSQPGRWRLRVIPADGHGLDVEVETAPPSEGPATALGAGSRVPPPSAGSAASSLLRPLLGVVVIALFFAALFLAWRKKARSPPR